MYNILVAINDSPLTKRVVEEAVSICHGRKEECTLTLLHIKSPSVSASAQATVQAPAQIPVQAPMQGTTMPVTVQPPLLDTPVDAAPNPPQEHEPGEKDAVLDRAIEQIANEGIEYITISKSGDPAREICNYAEDYDMDLIVMGRQDKGPIERIFIGSVSKKVVESAPVSVLVVKDETSEGE